MDVKVNRCYKRANVDTTPTCPKFDICKENYFVTSTGIGHRIIPSVDMTKQTFDYKIPKELQQPSVLLKEELKKTTVSESFPWSFNENYPIKISRIPFPTVHYISKLGEQMKLQPPNPFQTFKSEYQQKYQYFTVHPPNSNCVNRNPDVTCEVVTIDKTQRPFLTTESEGYSKFADPYNSTTHLNHHGFNRNEVIKYNTKIALPKPQLSHRIKPVYDELVFSKKYTEKILPKVVRHVTHSGLESEMKGNYRLPTDEMSSFSNRNTVAGLPPVTGPSKTDVYIVPFMYHTEYNQIGKHFMEC